MLKRSWNPYVPITYVCTSDSTKQQSGQCLITTLNGGLNLSAAKPNVCSEVTMRGLVRFSSGPTPQTVSRFAWSYAEFLLDSVLVGAQQQNRRILEEESRMPRSESRLEDRSPTQLSAAREPLQSDMLCYCGVDVQVSWWWLGIDLFKTYSPVQLECQDFCSLMRNCAR